MVLPVLGLMKMEAGPEQQVITTEQVRYWMSPVIS